MPFTRSHIKSQARKDLQFGDRRGMGGVGMETTTGPVGSDSMSGERDKSLHQKRDPEVHQELCHKAFMYKGAGLGVTPHEESKNCTAAWASCPGP